MTATLLFLATLAASPAREKAPAQEKPPSPAIPAVFALGKPVDPAITLKDIDGKAHRFGDYTGKTLVIDFWSNRCPWSRKAEPALLALQREFQPQGVVFLAIDSNAGDIADGRKDHFAEIRKYCKEQKVTYPILLDPENVVADRFQALTTPHLFVVDAKGVLRYDGGLTDDPKGAKENPTPWARNAIAAVVAGKKVPEPKTKVFGCTIKRVEKKDVQ